MPEQYVVYRCQIVSRMDTSRTLLDVPVPERPVQRSNPPLGCRDPLLGVNSKGRVGKVSMSAVSRYWKY